MVITMSILNTYTAYHVTDSSNLKSIKESGFTWKHNEKHWLGGGAYFFIDPSLPEHWYRNLPLGYGGIKIPVYLKVTISVTPERLIDTRFLKDYNKVKKEFDAFWETIGQYLFGNKYYEISTSGKDIKKDFLWRLRAAFFDWYKETNHIVCIIANFNERNKLSDYTGHGDIFLQFKIPYVETQVCVSDSTIITNIDTV